MSQETAATYGTGGPLAGSAGGVALHKEQTSVGQCGRDHTGNFTQVRAAVRCKTLLLLWWIDGGKMLVSAAHLPGSVASGRKWLRAYECEGVWINQPFLRLPWASFYRLRGHHNRKVDIMH